MPLARPCHRHAGRERLPIAPLELPAWLAWGLGLFAVGWVIQLVGHYYGAASPRLWTMMGFAGWAPFVVAEWGFALGLRAASNAVE